MPTIEKAKRWRNAKHRAQWQSTLETYALPVLGSKPVEDITRDDVLAVLRPIWDSKSETASRLRGRLEAVFSYAIATGKRVAANPATWRGNLDLFCRHLLASRRSSTMRRSPLMRLGRSSRTGTRPSRSSASAIVFGILTASRVGEFGQGAMGRDRLRCPSPVRAARAPKGSKAIPAPCAAFRPSCVYILSQIERKGEYVFARSAGSHISLETPRVVLQKKVGHGTMHGFRSTFRDWAAENGIDQVLLQKKASCMQPATRSNKRINVLICSSKGGPLCRHGLTRSCRRSDIFRELQKRPTYQRR
ncbi:MAG: tyrosine-type recombinase/integrase [Sutterella wadsworthensis]